MEEEFYMSISIDKIAKEEAVRVLEEVVRVRGTIVGMSVSYQEPIE